MDYYILIEWPTTIFSVEYHSNYQYVDFDGWTHSFYFLIFSDESGHWPLRQRCVHIHIYIYIMRMLLNSAAQSQSIFALSSSLKIYPMFIKVCFLAQTKAENDEWVRKRERKSKLSIAHHISFVWYWTTFRNGISL